MLFPAMSLFESVEYDDCSGEVFLWRCGVTWTEASLRPRLMRLPCENLMLM